MKLDKELIIKHKIDISGIIICAVLFVNSIASFIGYFSSNKVKDIKLLFLGTLFGIIVILLIPYLTFKRPYLKLNSNGIFLYRGFLSGKNREKTFIPWNKVEAIIDSDMVFMANIKRKIQKNELNAESISKLDKFNGFTPDDYEGEAEWLENSIYVVTKKENDINPEIYEIGSFLDKKNYSKNIEAIKKMWIEHIS